MSETPEERALEDARAAINKRPDACPGGMIDLGPYNDIDPHTIAECLERGTLAARRSTRTFREALALVALSLLALPRARPRRRR